MILCKMVGAVRKQNWFTGCNLTIAMVSVFTITTSPAHASGNCSDIGNQAKIAGVKTQRSNFNDAIANKDIDGIRAVLAENTTLVTGTDSALMLGRRAQLDVWAGDFKDPARTLYKRETACVQVSPILPIAIEHGFWRGTNVVDDSNFAGGRYTAKWRLVDRAWQVESEIYQTESCGGSFCSSIEESK